MEVSRPILLVCLSVSVLSAASSVYLAFGRPAPVAAPAGPGASVCACDDAAIRRELADLRRAVARVSSPRANDPAAARATGPSGADPGGSLAPSTAAGGDTASPLPGAPPVLADGHPAFTAFDIPNDAISVRQEPGGSLAVTNHDPALTGKPMTLHAHAADGSVEDVLIIVPPPEN